MNYAENKTMWAISDAVLKVGVTKVTFKFFRLKGLCTDCTGIVSVLPLRLKWRKSGGMEVRDQA